VKTTIEERERHALVVSPSEDLPCSVPELIVAERTEALAARLSQLEGSTRAALAKIETALARHDGDIAELRDVAHAPFDFAPLVARIDTLESGFDVLAGKRLPLEPRRADQDAIEAFDALRRLCDALDVLPDVGASMIPMRIEEAIAMAHETVEDLRVHRERVTHLSAKLTEARAEQERDLANLFEALGGTDATEPRPRTTARHAWQALIEQVRRTADALREEQGLRRAAEASKIEIITPTERLVSELEEDRDRLRAARAALTQECLTLKGERDDYAQRLADMTKSRDIVAEQRDVANARANLAESEAREVREAINKISNIVTSTRPF